MSYPYGQPRGPLPLRYEVRQRGGAWGVWDRYLLGWMVNMFETDQMGRYDAEVLADDLNTAGQVSL